MNLADEQGQSALTLAFTPLSLHDDEDDAEDVRSTFQYVADYSSDEDIEMEDGPPIPEEPTESPAAPCEQELLTSFLSAFMTFACWTCPGDIGRIIVNFLPDTFQYRLGLLLWRPFHSMSEMIVSERYSRSRRAAVLSAIRMGIAECIAAKEFDMDALRQHILNSSPANCSAATYVTLNMSPHTKGVPFRKDQREVYEMLREIVKMPDDPEIGIPQWTHSTTCSNPRDIGVLAIETLPTPVSALAFRRTASDCLASAETPLSLPQIQKDISLDMSRSCGPANDDDSDDDSDSDSGNRFGFQQSFVMDTLRLENQERGIDLDKLHKQLVAFMEPSGSSIIEHMKMDINHMLLDASCLLRAECPAFIPASGALVKTAPVVVAKAIEMRNQQTLTLDLVNVFTEIRMNTHYVEMLSRKEAEDAEHAVEPFGNAENVLSIVEFLNNCPLLKGGSLPTSPRYQYAVNCISSMATHIVHRVMRPLPLQPTHVIHDSLADFLTYNSAFARFVSNKTTSQLFSDSLRLPTQFDFWIIPQCVSEAKIEYQYDVLSDYAKQTQTLHFGIGEHRIGDIAELLISAGLPFMKVRLHRENAYKQLTRNFSILERTQSQGNRRRYIFIIDRRCPAHDGEFELNENHKHWADTLYIFCPPSHGEISAQCEVVPEGFIDRTLSYLLPLKDKGMAMGADCVANGYMFVTSYHVSEEEKVKAYFHSSGYGQRLTKDDVSYYWPRLFAKIDGEFQDEHSPKQIESAKQEFTRFLDGIDAEHRRVFRQVAMQPMQPVQQQYW